MSAGVEIDDVCAELLVAWRAEVGHSALTQLVDRLDADELARLSTDLTAHWVTLKRSLGPLSTRWLPRTSLRAYQRLAGGNVVLRDVIDLMVGTTSGDVASVALLDVTTSPLGEGANASCAITPSSKHCEPRRCRCAPRCSRQRRASSGAWTSMMSSFIVRSPTYSHHSIDCEQLRDDIDAPTPLEERINRLIDEAPSEPATLTDDHRRSLSARFRAVPANDHRRLDAWMVERAGRPWGPFRWSPATARRVVGNAALRRTHERHVAHTI